MDIVYLVLENGMAFAGHPIGAWKGTDPGLETVGELVFTTGMTGYLETLTDPSYAGQIILQTFPMIGNYGLIPEDFEGACHAKGYVVRELCDAPSNFRNEGTLDTFLKEQGIPGICGVDTRALTRLIREQGVMNACLCRAVPEDLSPVKAYAVQHVVSRVSTPTVQVFEPISVPAPNSSFVIISCGTSGLRCQAEHYPQPAEAGLPCDAAAARYYGGGNPCHGAGRTYALKRPR
jgi:carbamoyl-phosphate synthase small subunit